MNNQAREALIREWATPAPLRWHSLKPASLDTALNGVVFAVCLETIDATTASKIDARMTQGIPWNLFGCLGGR